MATAATGARNSTAIGIKTGATAKRSIMVTKGPAESSRTLNPASRIAADQPKGGGQAPAGGLPAAGPLRDANPGAGAPPQGGSCTFNGPPSGWPALYAAPPPAAGGVGVPVPPILTGA